MSQFAGLVNFANSIPGVSTFHYFYMNEAIAAIPVGTAGAAWSNLSSIAGHSELLQQSFYSCYA